ncbi:MAG: carbonic anhydrase [Deltaproteobacteria bacterium]|nr:carbonic anhydrase [Deltaproteobacteria bacterium]
MRAWLAHARPCMNDAGFPAEVGAVPTSATDRLSKRNVLGQLTALRTYRSVAERERAGRLRLHGWWFDIRRPRVEVFDVSNQRFVPFDAFFDGALP